MFTLSYDLGIKLQETSQKPGPPDSDEPDLFLALFDVLVIHDYDSGKTSLSGSEDRFDEIAKLIREHQVAPPDADLKERKTVATFASNFTKAEYIAAVERIHELIRRGDTYQVNLTQQLRCAIPPRSSPETVFRRLRRDHPAPFAAFLKRKSSTVVSASPERFFRVTRDRTIESSPIKGTRRRGVNPDEDDRLRRELQLSQKDRAENTMIVDLVRNDLGRVCEFGSVTVEKLCDIEEHPTLFHLVSTVRGKLRQQVRFSEILRAVFPCGSITGAPKIRTMQIIDEIEPADRGLSMGAIGCYIPATVEVGVDTTFDLSVAIRTMVIRGEQVVFNVGGGIVIDSDPAKEYDESLLKAAALLRAIGTE
jgi:aminodeoxychorismate synthase component I